MKCPYCGNSAKPHFQRKEGGVWKCSNRACRLEFLNPQPNDDQLSAAYAGLYYPGDGPRQKAHFENTPLEVLEQLFDHLDRRMGGLDGLELLDYGCGKGQLCSLASAHRISAVGIEPSATARTLAGTSGVAVFSSLAELTRSIPAARFDMITLWDVIEHLREPWSDLRSLKSLLKARGCMIISTMNTKSLRARLQGPKWENYSNPTHTFFFNRQSLGSMIAGAGFANSEEWILPIRYPHHGFLRRLVHRTLMAASLNSEIVFVGKSN